MQLLKGAKILKVGQNFESVLKIGQSFENGQNFWNSPKKFKFGNDLEIRQNFENMGRARFSFHKFSGTSARHFQMTRERQLRIDTRIPEAIKSGFLERRGKTKGKHKG